MLRDLLLVAGCTGAAALLATLLEVNERVFGLTRRLELYQLDELPYVLLVLCIGLGWLVLRRHHHLTREIRAHLATQARLEAAMLENRQLALERMQAAELERKRLARDLHDELGQYLSLIRLDALQCTGEPAASIMRSVEHLQRTVRSMMSALRPVALDDLGLSAALEHCIASWRESAAPMGFELSITGQVDDLPEDMALTGFRIIQEGLTNAVRHAGATAVQLSVSATIARPDGAELSIRIADDGRGLSGEAPLNAQGIRGMRERAELAGGLFSIAPGSSGGTVVAVTIPYATPP